MRVNQLFAYVVGASKNPDGIDCLVPYEIDKKTIFFGSCKKPLRKHLYEKYVKEYPKDIRNVSSENLYIIGFNASNPNKTRKIVWVGKITKLFTYERAYNEFWKTNSKFKKMLSEEFSPLNLKPIYEDGSFVGYRLHNSLHEENNEWVLDVINRKDDKNVKIMGKKLILKDPSQRKDVFSKDCCFLCDNIFFAKGKGIDIDEKIIQIFKEFQPEKKEDIDGYAIFGKTSNGRVDGLRGDCLKVSEPKDRMMELIALVKERAREIEKYNGDGRRNRYQATC